MSVRIVTPEHRQRDLIKVQRASVRRWDAAVTEWRGRLGDESPYVAELRETLAYEKALLADLIAGAS